MRLAFIINVFREDEFHSGGERLFYEIISTAINRGFDVDLYCCKHIYGDKRLKFNKIIMEGNAKFFKSPKKIEKVFGLFGDHIKKENYSHIITENITPSDDIAIMQGHSAKHYVDMSGNIFSKVIMTLKKREFLIYQKKWFKRGYKKIIVPSNVLKNELIKNFNIPAEKFKVIYPGVDIPENIEIKKTKPITIGLSAPSFRNKGGYVFLKALARLKKYDFYAKIIYPKKNPLLKLYIKFLGLENRVKFLPYQADMMDFYSAVDVVAVPSYMETFALVALEAMAHGKIAVVSSHCGASEIIEDGVDGFVFQGSDDRELAQKLEIPLNSDTQNISKNAHNKSKDYSWQKMAELSLNSFISSNSL